MVSSTPSINARFEAPLVMTVSFVACWSLVRTKDLFNLSCSVLADIVTFSILISLPTVLGI